ncbi:endo-1,4-beta-xylanase [Paenibacillus albus]|nr:endo-1,4-beta-xylanase [Paenibacillus albus]
MQTNIRRVISLLMALALLIPQGWFALHAEAAVNSTIVLQQSFEDESAGGWEKLSWGGDGNAAVSTDIASDGTKSLKFTNRASRNSSLSRDMLGLLQSDHMYDISFKVRSGLGSDTFHLASKVVSGGATDYPWLIGNKTITDTDWTTFELKGYQVPSNTTEFRVWLESDSTSTSTADVYLDEVLIKDVTPPVDTPSSVVLDQGFEDNAVGSWEKLSWGGDGNAAVSGDMASEGSHSLKFTNRASRNSSLSRNLTGLLASDHTYDLSFKVRLGQGTDTFHLASKVTSAGADSYPWLIGNKSVTDSGWTTFELKGYQVPSNTTELRIWFESDSASTSTADFYLDEVLIKDVTPSSGSGGEDPGDLDQSGVSSDFEDGVQGWVPRNDGDTVSASTADNHTSGGAQSLLATAGGQYAGPLLNVLGKMHRNDQYNLSVWVKMAPDQDATSLRLSLQHGDSMYANVSANTTVTDSAWVKLSGTFTMTHTPTVLNAYVETAADNGGTRSFYIDDFQLSYVGPVDNSSLPLPVQTDIPSMKDVYADDFTIGAAVTPDQLTGETAELLKKHYNSLVAENAMKWDAIEPTEGQFNFTGGDAIRQFAVDNGMKMRGHTLLWHQQTPAWVFKNAEGGDLTNSPEDQQLLLQRLENHIKGVVQHFGTDIQTYDVVNEVIDPSQPDGFRRSKWYEILGPSYIDKAFEFAHEYAPVGTKLVINDYSTTDTAKRKFLYDLVKGMKERGVPVDAVGHQMHINIERPTADEIKQTFDMFAELGVENQVTELDISVYAGAGNYTSLSEDVDIQLGHRYAEVFDAFKASKASLTGVTIWGIADDHTWLDGQNGHTKDYPLPFDTRMQAKQAYWGIVDPSQLKVMTHYQSVAQGTPVIDGTSELTWSTVSPIIIPATGGNPLRAAVKPLWDENHLYVYVDVTDPTSDASDQIDLYVDGNNGKTAAYEEDDKHFTLKRNHSDVEGVTYSVVERSGGYIIEAALPLAGAVVDQQIGFDLTVTDGGNDSPHSIAWNDTTFTQASNTSKYGVFQFINSSKTTDAIQGTPVIDGKADTIWSKANEISTDVWVTGTSGATAKAKTMWDAGHLYIYAVVTDNLLSKASANAYEEDSVEIFVDPNNDKTASYEPDDGQYRVNFDNEQSGGGSTSLANLHTATRRISGGYVVEAAIDVDSSFTAKDSLLGFDLQVNNDQDGNGTRSSVAMWNDPTGNSWQSTSRFGVVRLVGAPAVDHQTGGGGGSLVTVDQPKAEGGKITPTVKSTEGGHVTAEVTSELLKNALGQAAVDANGKKLAVISLDAQSGANSYSVQLPAQSLSAAGNYDIKVESELGDILLPSDMLAGMNLGNADSIAISITKAQTDHLSPEVSAQIGKHPIVNLEVLAGDQVLAWNNPHAPVTVAVPYKPTAEELSHPDSIVVWYIAGDGSVTAVPNGRYDAATGTVVFQTTHFSSYAVVSQVKTFGDLASVPWAKQAIEAMAARDVIKGTSADSFSPADSIKRADFIALLVRALELKGTAAAGKGAAAFSDVSPSAYYYNELSIAKELGIATGFGDNTFKPDSTITRQDMMVLAARALAASGKQVAASESLDAYSDASSVAAYAKASAAALVKAGIVIGNSGKLSPDDSLTRAEAAVMLYRMWKL